MTSTSTASIKLRMFDVSTMKWPTRVVIIGASQSGKTKVGLHILHEFRHLFPAAIVFSGAEADKPIEERDYWGKIPDSFVHDGFDPRILKRMFLRQRSLVVDFKKHPELMDNLHIKQDILVIADDVMHCKEWKRSPEVQRIFFSGRQSKASFMLMMQYPMGIIPELRGNLRYVFLFPDQDPKVFTKYYENYCQGAIPTKEIFAVIYKQLQAHSKSHYCLVIDRNVQSDRWEDSVFWFKATLYGHFRIGSKVFWEYHRRKYDKHYMEKAVQDEMDLDNMRGGPKIRFSSQQLRPPTAQTAVTSHSKEKKRPHRSKNMLHAQFIVDANDKIVNIGGDKAQADNIDSGNITKRGDDQIGSGDGEGGGLLDLDSLIEL